MWRRGTGMGEAEGLGEAVTGAMLARVVEPGAGEVGADGHTHEQVCLNCGCRLVGAYCHCCGQKAHIHRSIRAFVSDFIAGVLNFEGKFWRTLPMLAWRPGEMTRRYIDGERAKFISPAALYLFTVFLMFAVLSFTGAMEPGVSPFERAATEQRAEIARLESERAAVIARGGDAAVVDLRIAKARKDLEEVENFRSGKMTSSADLGDSPAWVRTVVERVQRNPELVANNIQDAASKYSWALIPVSVPFLWLLFPFSRRFRLYDHTVFVTYSLSFMMMLVVAGGVLVPAGATAIAGFLLFIPPFHMYRQLKGAYGLGRFSALIRTVLLQIFALVALLLFAMVLVALGLFA